MLPGHERSTPEENGVVIDPDFSYGLEGPTDDGGAGGWPRGRRPGYDVILPLMSSSATYENVSGQIEGSRKTLAPHCSIRWGNSDRW